MNHGKIENFIMVFTNINRVLDLIDNSHCNVWDGLTIDESFGACEKIIETGLEELAIPIRAEIDDSEIKVVWVIHGEVVATYKNCRRT